MNFLLLLACLTAVVGIAGRVSANPAALVDDVHQLQDDIPIAIDEDESASFFESFMEQPHEPIDTEEKLTKLGFETHRIDASILEDASLLVVRNQNQFECTFFAGIQLETNSYIRPPARASAEIRLRCRTTLSPNQRRLFARNASHHVEPELRSAARR